MKKILITTGLLLGLAFTANAQMTPNPNDPNQQQPGVQTPGTPPTFPTERQDTAKDRQQSNQSDADMQQTGKDRDRHDKDRTDSDRLPQSDRTDRDQDNQNAADRDRQSTDRDRDEQYPQSTDRDQQNQQVQSGRDYDRDRQNGSIGSNAGQQDQDRNRKDDLDTGMNPDRDHRSEYQSQLEKALQQNPNLSGVQVAYTDSTVELTGTVPTGKEKHEARMMAHDYANGRKVVDHIAVTGKGQ